MSLPATITVIVILDIALIGFLAWMMSHPRHLTPHVSTRHTKSSRQPDEQHEIQLATKSSRRPVEQHEIQLATKSSRQPVEQHEIQLAK